jgi:hypothetical protein
MFQQVQRVPTGPNGSPQTCRCVCRRFFYVFVVLWRCIIPCISIVCVLHCIDKYFGVIIIWWLKRAEDDVNGEEDDVNGEKNWQWGLALEYSSTLNG